MNTPSIAHTRNCFSLQRNVPRLYMSRRSSSAFFWPLCSSSSRHYTVYYLLITLDSNGVWLFGRYVIERFDNCGSGIPKCYFIGSGAKSSFTSEFSAAASVGFSVARCHGPMLQHHDGFLSLVTFTYEVPVSPPMHHQLHRSAG